MFTWELSMVFIHFDIKGLVSSLLDLQEHLCTHFGVVGLMLGVCGLFCKMRYYASTRVQLLTP